MSRELIYLCSILNTTIKMTTPILLASLAAALCKKVNVMNIAMEGAMMGAAFFAIVVNYWTHSVFLSLLAAMAAGMALSMIVAFCIIRLKGNAVVVGMAANSMMNGLTIFLLYQIFHTRGVFTDSSLKGLSKAHIPWIEHIPVLAKILENLTYVDYLAVLAAIVIQIFLYRTVLGYRLRAVGINADAARSLGTRVERMQFWTVSLSGLLCGLGGILLSMGPVTLFIQNITSGKGYIAMAAMNLGAASPIGVTLASFFFGFCTSIGNVLQQSVKMQITASIPYAATIAALCVFAAAAAVREKRRKAGRKNG